MKNPFIKTIIKTERVDIIDSQIKDLQGIGYRIDIYNFCGVCNEEEWGIKARKKTGNIDIEISFKDKTIKEALDKLVKKIINYEL